MNEQTDPADNADAPVNLLAQAAVAHGESIKGGANRPFHLAEPDLWWFVVDGAVDVFIARRAADGTESDFKHLLRAGAGRLLFDVRDVADDDDDGGDDAAVLIAKGLPGSELRRVPCAAVYDAASDSECGDLLAAQVDAWVTDFSSAVTHDITYRPPVDLLLAPAGDVLSDDATVTVEARAEAGNLVSVSVRSGVLWVSSEKGGMAFLGTESADDADALVPVTAHSWLSLFEASRLRALSSRQLVRDGRLASALELFHRLAISASTLNQNLLRADMANLQIAHSTHLRMSGERAQDRLYNVLNRKRAWFGGTNSKLLGALKVIGRHENIHFRAPPPQRGEIGKEPPLSEILSVSAVRSRRILLAPEERWWHGDSGAMLGYQKADGAPVALLPGRRRYRMVDTEGRSTPVNTARAAELHEEGVYFYRPLPNDRALKTADLMRFSFQGLGGEFARFMLSGILVGGVMLLPAILLGWVVDNVLPGDDPRILAEATIALILLGLLGAGLQMLQGTSLMRIEARAAARATAALWDRIIGLPQRFFRGASSGDLGTRAMAFLHLRDSVSGIVAQSVLTVVFLLPTFGLLFWYDHILGWIGLIFGLVSISVTLTLGVRQIPYHRRMLEATSKLGGELVQLLAGIGKLRSTGSEEAAFTIWARRYRAIKENELRIGTFMDHLVAFSAAAPLVATAALFLEVVSNERLAVGDFLAVYSAFMVFYAAIGMLGHSVSEVASIGPACEQVEPIIRAVPMSESHYEAPPELSGDIRLDHVTFGYMEGAPPVLNDVSIHARPGEFIALVGESGGGKTTIFRLALGLEKPQSGAVYYDRRDLAHINQRSVRRSIGVVVQDASLRAGTVLDNIIGLGNSELTIEDAWRAAEQAVVADDIRAMPMQMFTDTGQNMNIFSGGQLQRIMLASALVRNPRVLFLDEATNWLDNESQAKVMNTINRMPITRIASAHRLSTIRNADRIYVLENGRIVQQGTFEELMAEKGVFQVLAQRQLA